MTTMHIRLAAAGLLALAAAAPVAAQRPTPPAPAPARPIQFPTYTERTLPNGLRLLVVESQALPLVSVDLYVGDGDNYEPPAQLGVGGLTASMLDKGTERRTALQIAQEIEGVGGTLTASGNRAQVVLSSSVLSDQLPLAFDLLSDVALHPTFPADELQTVKQQTLTGLRLQLSQPASIASRQFAAEVYGTANPYGTQATPATVEALTREDLAAFHRRHFVPGNALLVVAGAVTPAVAEQLATRYFGSWRGAAPAAEAFPAPPAARGTRIVLVNRPGSVQSNVIVGHLGTEPGSPDYWALQVANSLLGGTEEARLFKVLRSEKGWTYGAYSAFTRPRQVGSFQANTEVRTAVTDSAVAELLVQLRRMRDEPVPAAELEAGKAFLVASYPNRFETPDAIAGQIADQLLLGLAPAQLEEYPRRVAAVTAADVQRVARRYLRPDSAVIVVVGDAPALLAKLEAIAPVTLVDVSGAPVDRASLEVRAPTESFDGASLQPVRLAYNIVFQGNAVGQVSYALTREGENWLVTSSVQAGPSTTRGEVRFTDDLTPVSYRNTQQAGPVSVEIDLRVQDGRVTGTAKLPPQAGGDKTFDQEIVAGTRLPEMDAWVLAAADLAEGKTITLPVFNPQSGSVVNVQFRVTGTETVTVGAGAFESYRVEATGSQGGGVLFVRKEGPHLLVKQEITGQPVTIELQSLQ